MKRGRKGRGRGWRGGKGLRMGRREGKDNGGGGERRERGGEEGG